MTKISLWGTVFTILAIIILCGLGVWQLNRLMWKLDILKQLDREYKLNADFIPLTLDDFKEKSGYKRGFVEGKFLHEFEAHISPRVYEGKLGYLVVTPLQITGRDEVVIVNRGWAIADSDNKNGVFRPEEVVRVTGMIRQPSDRNLFTPVNESSKNEWYSISAAEILMAHKLNGVSGRVMYQEGNDIGLYPIPQTKRIMPNNNHAFYAFFWFLMAFVLGTIYWTCFFDNRLKNKKSYFFMKTNVD